MSGGGDRRKDQGREGGRAGGSFRDDRTRSELSPGAQKSYRAKLDKLFSSGKIGEIVAQAERDGRVNDGSTRTEPKPLIPGTSKQDDARKNGPAFQQLNAALAKAIMQTETQSPSADELANARTIDNSEGASVLRRVQTKSGPDTGRFATVPTQTGQSPLGGGETAESLAKGQSPANDELSKPKLIAKLIAAEGRDAVTKAAEALLADHPLPDDFDLLTKLLEHRDPARITLAISRLEVLLRTKQPRRARMLLAQLRLLEETSDDAEVRLQAANARRLVKAS